MIVVGSGMSGSGFRVSSVKSVISASIGNTLEWFEYTLYAYFASVISQLFFPLSDPFVSKILTFATFALGLAARPFGGIVFGYIGDRYSRKNTMTFTMLMMSIPTTLIGFLPTYEVIGIAAPIMLVALRIIQGVALGGEFGSSCVYLYELVPVKYRGFFGSLSLTGVGCGLILSSLTILVVESIFTQQEIISYVWRFPFFISVVGSMIALYMRRNLLETIDFEDIKSQKQLVANPLLEMFKKHKLTILRLFAIFLTTQISFFVVFIYGKTMMIDFMKIDSRHASLFTLLTVTSYTIATLIFGYLADRINKRWIILAGCVGIFCFSWLFIEVLLIDSDMHVIILCCVMGGFIGMTEGTLNPLVSESFPVNIRATSVSFCWNFTAVGFGGVAPIISMWLTQKFNDAHYVAYFLMTACAISILVLIAEILKKKISAKS